jgi:phosphate transport system protein
MRNSLTEDVGQRVVSRSALQAALHEAEERTLGELRVVRTLLRRAVEAATTGDPSAAEAVEADARELDRRYGDVHDRLLSLIACQGPVAGDLRLAIALLHVNDRIERMGAQCVNVATLCRQIPSGQSASAGQLECLSTMAELADEQVAEAERVFAERDREGARDLRKHDLEINGHNRRCFELAVQNGSDESRREVGFFVALMARALERIGDNAVDIGQQASFAATGRRRPALPGER